MDHGDLSGADALAAELDLWRAAGRIARLWLRDDDACAPSAALDALLTRLRSVAAPCLLAVIPLRAGDALADRLRGEPLVSVATHGVRHANHAPEGSKAEETPLGRGLDVILADLAEARARMITLFGEGAARWYVPPWNRIGCEVASRLPEAGFEVLSVFAGRIFDVPGLKQANTHVDIIDWKGGRVGRSATDVLGALVAELALARRENWRPVGVLTHHLVHDAVAWATLDIIVARIAAHPSADWIRPDDVVADMSPVGSESCRRSIAEASSVPGRRSRRA